MVKEISMRLTSRGSTVAEHLPHHPMVEGLSPAIAETRRQNGKKKKGCA
jgi:hypothetical protein